MTERSVAHVDSMAQRQAGTEWLVDRLGEERARRVKILERSVEMGRACSSCT